LEERQRARRKEYEAIKKHHEPKWFKIVEKGPNEPKEFEYLGDYW